MKPWAASNGNLTQESTVTYIFNDIKLPILLSWKYSLYHISKQIIKTMCHGPYENEYNGSDKHSKNTFSETVTISKSSCSM